MCIRDSLECAVKFYLRVGAGTELRHFIGPGKVDRLDIKYQRFLNHQLPIDQHPAASAILAAHQFSITQQALLLQGYLFHPWGEGCPPQLAAEINPHHWQGWWLRQGDVKKLSEADSALRFAILQKPFWLAARADENLELERLEVLLSGVSCPVLISRGYVTDHGWKELDRGFVVPDNW